MRRFISIEVEDPEKFKENIVKYCRLVDYGVVYNSNRYYQDNQASVSYSSFGYMAAIGHVDVVQGDFDIMKSRLTMDNDWWCGYWAYDLKNDLEKLYSVNHDGLSFPNSIFFRPKYVFIEETGSWKVGYMPSITDKKEIYALIAEIEKPEETQGEHSKVCFIPRVSKDKYCRSIDSVLHHIHKGDIYELNYCMEFFAENVVINPYDAFLNLNRISPTPFASFLKLKEKFVLSASPERFIKKEGNKIISQPIKGTAKRGANRIEDEQLVEALKTSVKERSENIMIVDLVRNDLSRVAGQGTVKVEELCGIYPFRQVHQMISTVTAELADGMEGVDAITASFPAGSMTGAPKIRAMKLIEKYEETKRGVYSGAIGYFSPNGDFDFNVVIRSLIYNASNKYLSFMVGSAITEKSIAEDEYEECLLKAKAIFELFGNPQD